jgi:hypothetical protein
MIGSPIIPFSLHSWLRKDSRRRDKMMSVIFEIPRTFNATMMNNLGAILDFSGRAEKLFKTLVQIMALEYVGLG